MDLSRLSLLLLQMLGGVLGLYLLYGGTVFMLQRQILFPGQHIPGPEPPSTGIPHVERLWIEIPGARSEAWLLPPEADATPPHPAVIVAHGNAELIDHLAAPLKQFRAMGAAVMLVEYPGYGRSEGAPTQETIGEVFREAYDRLARRAAIDQSRIAAYGRSVGGGVACQLAADRSVAALILQSAFTHTGAFAREFFLPPFLVKDPFNNVSVLRSYGGPVLIIHGRRDQQIPFAHAQRLTAAAGDAELVAYDCGHNDCPPRWDVFWRDVSSFLRQHGVLR